MQLNGMRLSGFVCTIIHCLNKRACFVSAYNSDICQLVCILLRHMVVQHYINGDSLTQWGKAKFDPSQNQDTLIVCHC